MIGDTVIADGIELVVAWDGALPPRQTVAHVSHTRYETAPCVAFSWDTWYANNKTRLSKERARRYKEDPAYREAALMRSRVQRGKDFGC